MFYRFRDRLQRARFNHACRDILHTPPLVMRDAPLCIVTQVSHRDVLMYLIAIKSIYRFVRAARVFVLDDGSLTTADRDLIERHLPAVSIRHISAIKAGCTPRGGTWERLLLISELVRDSYVVQMDSDSLTINDIPEVLNFIAANCSFTLLGAESFPAIESMRDACERAKHKNPNGMEPQGISERSLDRISNCADLKYVRGCSAFAGFARQSFTRADVEQFSKQMETLCGSSKWSEWGSEQVTSNLIVANSPNASVLPSPKYISFYALPTVDYARSSFLHFMGTHRFEGGSYATLARQVIHEITSDPKRVLSAKIQAPGNLASQAAYVPDAPRHTAKS